MSTSALYDVLQSFQDIHQVVLNLAGELNDEQLQLEARRLQHIDWIPSLAPGARIR